MPSGRRSRSASPDDTAPTKVWQESPQGGGGSSRFPIGLGWLKDRYGLSWQIVPTERMEMLDDPDPAKVQRVTEAMLKVRGKFDIGELRAAFEGV